MSPHKKRGEKHNDHKNVCFLANMPNSVENNLDLHIRSIKFEFTQHHSCVCVRNHPPM